ncbi:MAG TPA: DHA2 family efflux MFS transporter permease subunit [Chitinophagaceae bacterium]|nr:DHA2 family efflux MFS transporter permease subunit [Chitinophagaceae bacterium]
MENRDPNSMVEYGARRVIITLTVILCSLLELIDTTIVNVATTTLAGNLGATFSEVSWVIASYAIANVIVVPMSGWLSAQFGRKRYFAASIALFTFASFMCGQSSSIWMLVFWRFVQGVGGGALIATSQSILVEIYPKEKLGMASAMFGMGVILGPTLGPLFGGYLIDHYAWPVIFLVNVPFGILSTFLTIRYIRDNPHQKKSTDGIDWLGLLLLIVGIGGLQLFLEQGENEEWFDSKYITAVFIISVGSLIWLILRELRVKNPIVDFRILLKGNVAIGVSMSFILGFVLFGTVFIIPIYMQRFLGYTAQQTGALFTPGALLTGFCMPLVGMSLQKGIPPKALIVIGFALTAVFVFWCSGIITPATPSDAFFWPLMVRGLGMGLLFVPLTNLLLGGLEGKDVAQASGLSSMIRQIGGSISVALIGTVSDRLTAQHKADLLTQVHLSNPAAVERLQGMSALFQSKGSDASRAMEQSYSILDLNIFKQAYILTYINIFQYMALFVLCIIPLILFARTYKKKAITDAAH